MTEQSPDPDHLRLTRVRGGDVDAFEALFVAYHATLCELVDAYVGSPAVAEEIVQDLFYAVWKDRDRLDVRGSVRSYLCVAARNRAIQHLRHQAVAVRWAERAAAEPAHDSMASVGAALEQTEILAALRAAIDELPPRARLAVVLRWRHRLTNSEVAESMGISVKGVEKLLASAMHRLREGMRSHRDGG